MLESVFTSFGIDPSRNPKKKSLERSEATKERACQRSKKMDGLSRTYVVKSVRDATLTGKIPERLAGPICKILGSLERSHRTWNGINRRFLISVFSFEKFEIKVAKFQYKFREFRKFSKILEKIGAKSTYASLCTHTTLLVSTTASCGLSHVNPSRRH